MSPARIVIRLAVAAALVASQTLAVMPRSPAVTVARVPIEPNGNVVFVRVRVEGSRPLSFVLDTGAQGSCVNESVARSLGLRMDRPDTSTGAGGRVASGRVPDVTLGIGEAQLSGVTLAALHLASLENGVGRAIDGILGSDLFQRFVVEIDYEANEIRLHEPAGFDYRGPGESLPIDFHDDHPYVRAKVILPGREPLVGEFVLDAGSALPLILLPDFIAEKGLRAALPPTLETYGRGVGGDVILPVGRVSRLQLGGFALENPVTGFPRSGTFGRSGKAGNIGGAVLRRFRVTFDYSHRRVILEPNGRFPDPFEFDMSGLQLLTESPAFDVLRVKRVLANSPAAEAGIRAADEILSFDGRPATAMRLAELREMLRQPDREYPLRIKRGAETLSVSLKTRRLL